MRVSYPYLLKSPLKVKNAEKGEKSENRLSENHLKTLAICATPPRACQGGVAKGEKKEKGEIARGLKNAIKTL